MRPNLQPRVFDRDPCELRGGFPVNRTATTGVTHATPVSARCELRLARSAERSSKTKGLRLKAGEIVVSGRTEPGQVTLTLRPRVEQLGEVRRQSECRVELRHHAARLQRPHHEP